MIRFVLKPFGYDRLNMNYGSNYYNEYGVYVTNERKNVVETNKNELMKNFNQQVDIYRNRYPRYPRNVRFSQEEIDNYFENTVRIVKNFVEKQKIRDWIFEDYHLLLDDYEELTRSVWINIFGCG